MRFSTSLIVALAFAPIVAIAQPPTPPPTAPPGPPVSQPLPPADSGLTMQLHSRQEAKLERNKNERCRPGQSLFVLNCRNAFQPIFDVQFKFVSFGTLADRILVDLNYDSENEFDASNVVSLAYQGRGREVLQRLEVGNVAFTLPSSRFITRGIPSGNYGIQALTRFGPVSFRAIAAQQKGNVRREQGFTIGDRTLSRTNNRLDDHVFEARRFFFTIDPTLLAGYPNIDILDAQRMLDLSQSLPDTLRPTRVSLYRLRIGAPPTNPNGPQFIPRGARTQTRGPIYEYMREGTDYYADPSGLWVALLRSLSRDERLVVAYNVLLADGTTVYANTGGTPDIELRPGPQLANLLWDPDVAPGDSVFNREIRSAYRVGGDELQRASLTARVVTGNAADQEKPSAGTDETYLQMFGLAQSGNSATLDTENRVWPREGDANINIAASGGQRLIRDYFLIYPSAEPFSSRGLVAPGNPTNDTLYTTPTEDLYSPRRPQAVYHTIVEYATEGTGGAGAFQLQALQLRRESERVTLEGRLLRRDVDYTMDYDNGRLTLTRPHLMVAQPQRLEIEFEENPLFAPQPTTMFAFSAELPMTNGAITTTLIRQRQTSAFTRPTLGNEPAASLLAGVGARFHWDATGMTSLLDWLFTTTGPSRVATEVEFAMSRPDPNSENRAFVESFEGDGGITVPLADRLWYYSSQPIASPTLPENVIELPRASTLAWQGTGLGTNNELIRFTIGEIDPLTKLIGGAFSTPEPILWLTLYPLGLGGLRDDAGSELWTIGGTPGGRRWRSIRRVLDPSGIDLTRSEELTFWALIDTSVVRRSANATVVIDIGEISENSVAFSPDTVLVTGAGGVTSVAGYRGKQLEGLGVLDTEKDSFTRTFDAGVDDIGLRGDRADSVVLRDAQSGQVLRDSTKIPICRAERQVRPLGDRRLNCTVENGQLDEEDIDSDYVLNFDRDSERILRFRVDLSDPATYSRVGGCVTPTDPRNSAGMPRCWVQVRRPFAAPDANIGDPLIRRVRAMRITVVSGSGAGDTDFTELPIADLRLTGAPWLKRSDAPISGIAGNQPGTGYVIATTIGTMDSTANLVYQPPPGVIDQAEGRGDQFGTTQVQINERSMRLLAGGLDLHDRAEAYYRFPEGQKSFMGYEELRVWARGRGNGWGPSGELQFFIKAGRDADNFYLYRTPVNSGSMQQAWEPEVRVEFKRFYDLRARVENASLQNTDPISGCTALDSALIIASLPAGSTSPRYAACDGGYMIYTVDPRLIPPSLASVQEMAVGFIRVSDQAVSAPIAPTDTLELWVNDIRLTGVVDAPGFAGHFGIEVRGSDIFDFRGNVSRTDQNFRQLGEQPSFNTRDALDLSSTVHLGKFLPASFGVAMPLTINHRTEGSNPFFTSSSDVLAEGIVGLRTPRQSATTYSVHLRRATPLENSPYGILFNNIGLSSSYASSGTRSEYQRGRANNLTLGVDYNIAPDTLSVRLPGWLDRAVGLLPNWLLGTAPLAAFRSADYRYSPTLFSFSSAFAKGSNQRTSFTKPAASPSDTGRAVTGENHVWENRAAVNLLPLPSLQIRWDAVSLRDLRDYGDSTDAGRAAGLARRDLLGQDLGLERDRTMNGFVAFSPRIIRWLRPTVSLGSRFTMTRDPNARSLVPVGPDPEDGRLPRRINASQVFGAGADVDLATLVKTYLGWALPLDSLSKWILPVDVRYNRTLLSSLDRAATMPGLGFQFALGGVEDFRRQDGRLASSAGVSNAFNVSGTLKLPGDLSLTNRFQRNDTRNWTRRQEDQHIVTDGWLRIFPDIALNGTWRTPPSIAPIVSSIGGQAGYTVTNRSTFAASPTTGAEPDRSAQRVRSYPANLAAHWGVLGGFSTTAGYDLAISTDLRPGSITDVTRRSYAAGISKTFAPRPAWKLPSDIRTNVNFLRQDTDGHVRSIATGNSSRLTDNGKHEFSLSGNTEVNETMSFELTGSRIVNFDENFNRRNVLTVFSVVMNLQFGKL